MEVKNNKRCMKEAKENWLVEQCNETKEIMWKNNSKSACQLVKDLTNVKQDKAIAIQDHSEKFLTEEQEMVNR